MKKVILAVPVALALVGIAAPASFAAVNCAMVKKELDRGKTPEMVAENMAVSIKEVNDCKAQTGTDMNPASQPNPNTAPKGVTPPATGSDAPNK